MKSLILILLCALPAFSQDSQLEVLRIPNFNAGVVSRYSPILIPDNAVQSARNVYFDEQGVTRRKGYSQFNSAIFTDAKSVRGVWPFTSDDGTRYVLALSSQTIYKAETDGVFTAIDGLSNLSAVADMDAVAYLGKAWLSNGTNSMAYWDGASTKTVTEAPLGGMIEGWRNRIVVAGIAGSLSYVYMSKELDGEEWTTGPTTSVDPVALAFGGTNAKPIKCVYGGFKDFLFVGNEDEIYGVYGFGRNDFVIRTISREVGCIEDKSVQEKDGALYWMSRRGIEKMATQGGTIRISDGVKDVFDTMIGNTAINRLKLYTTQAHWEAGTLNASGNGAKISATISPGSIVPSTWSYTDTDGSDWNSGTVSNIDTTTLNGSIKLLPDTSSRTYETFSGTLAKWEYGTGDNCFAISDGKLRCLNPTYTAIKSGNIHTATATINYGSWSFDINASAFKVATDSPIGGSQWYYFVSSSSNVLTTSGYAVKVTLDGNWNKSTQLIRIDSGTEQVLASSSAVVSPTSDYYNTFLCYFYSEPQHFQVSISTAGLINVKLDSTDIITVTDSSFVIGHSLFNIYKISHWAYYYDGRIVTDSYIDNIYVTGTYPANGTWTSPIYDTTFSTPIGGPFLFIDTIPSGSTIAYSVRQSSYNSTSGMGAWATVSTTTSGAYRIPFNKEFWQYKADLSTQYSTQTPSVEYVTLQAATTGEYIHECADTSGSTSWGSFQANSVLNGGSISYFVSTGSTCDSVQRDTATWTAQANNAPITVSTANYTGVKEVFTIDSSSQTALLRDVTLNWLEGTARPPVASAIYKERYYLAYTTSSSNDYNDFIFVADKNDAPTFLDHINCYSLALFNRNMYCGDSTGTGKMYQLETGESDNGESFTSSFRTKAYSFGDTDTEKEFVKMYTSFSPEVESILDINITPSYHLDLSTMAITLNPINTGEDSTAGMLVAKTPFSMSNNLTGRFLDLEFTNTGKDGGWTLFNLNVYFRRLELK